MFNTINVIISTHTQKILRPLVVLRETATSFSATCGWRTVFISFFDDLFLNNRSNLWLCQLLTVKICFGGFMNFHRNVLVILPAIPIAIDNTWKYFLWTVSSLFGLFLSWNFEPELFATKSDLLCEFKLKAMLFVYIKRQQIDNL